jgi:glycosyltransferase involved in cell wall biosynthesis
MAAPMNTAQLSDASSLDPSAVSAFEQPQEALLPPTVLFVDQSGQLGGAEFSLLPLALACRGRSEVVLLSDGPFRTRLESHGVQVSLFNEASVSSITKQALRFAWLKALPGMVRQVRSIAARARQYDVLFLNTQKAFVLGTLGKPLHRRPVIWHLHDIMTREHFGRVQLFIVKWLVRHAIDHVVANSRASADSLIELAGLPADSVPIVHNGIDANMFDEVDASDIVSLRRRLQLPESSYLVGMFGRLAPWKGQHIALEAIARIPDVHLVLVGAALFGEHAYEHSLHRQARALGIADRVHFAGFRDDMPTWMKAMDVIIHTSTEPEPFGRVIVEGMAAGCPVIAAAAGGVTEIIRHLKNGWLVKPGDTAAFANAIETLRAAPELAQRLSDQALADVRRDFSLERYVSRMTGAIADTAA